MSFYNMYSQSNNLLSQKNLTGDVEISESNFSKHLRFFK